MVFYLFIYLLILANGAVWKLLYTELIQVFHTIYNEEYLTPLVFVHWILDLAVNEN